MKILQSNSLALALAALVVISMVAGCKKEETATPQKPRPVEVAQLSKEGPEIERRLVKANVSAWRTETVSMEVGGRLTFLAEENTVFSPTGDGSFQETGNNFLPSLAVAETEQQYSGLLLARIEQDKYIIAKERAVIRRDKTQASINAAEEVDLKKLLPAQKTSAEAELDLASKDYDRAVKLLAGEAGSEAEKQRYFAKKQSAQAALDEINARFESKKSEIVTLKKQLAEDEQSLKDANRDLENCVLEFKRFRGELTNLEVERGDLIQPNQVIGQVLMMDPIQIEFEVSSADSRRLTRMEKLDVLIEGRSKPAKARVYEVDSVADPTSRTFTVKLLMVNGKFDEIDTVDGETPPPDPRANQPKTDKVIPLDISFLGEATKDKPFAAESWIFKDKKGFYVLRIENWSKKEPVPEGSLIVKRVDVKVGEERVLFYGNMYFREVTPIADDIEFDLERDQVIGEVLLPDGADPDSWDWEKDNEVLFDDTSQWLLRPGDLVDVDIARSATESNEYRMPIDAISHESNKFYIFLVSETDPATVEKVQIDILDDFSKQGPDETSSFLRIRETKVDNSNSEDSEESDRLKGRYYVRKGAHYLRDGERVVVIDAEQAITTARDEEAESQSKGKSKNNGQADATKDGGK